VFRPQERLDGGLVRAVDRVRAERVVLGDDGAASAVLDFPYFTLFYWPEAVNLGDLMRL